MYVGFGEVQLGLYAKCLVQRSRSQFQIQQIMSVPQHLTNCLGSKEKYEGPDTLKGNWFATREKKIVAVDGDGY